MCRGWCLLGKSGKKGSPNGGETMVFFFYAKGDGEWERRENEKGFPRIFLGFFCVGIFFLCQGEVRVREEKGEGFTTGFSMVFLSICIGIYRSVERVLEGQLEREEGKVVKEDSCMIL